MAALRTRDIEGYDEQLQSDAQFLCLDQRMDVELVDRLVLQLNRIYPQILDDKEACKFRRLSVPTKVRLPELLKHLLAKGEEACHEFYRALQIHAEEVYASLPTRIRQREMADSKWANNVGILQKRYVLNDKGPMFFLSCFSFVVGFAILYYYGERETLRSTGVFLHCSAARLKDAKDVFISYAEVLAGSFKLQDNAIGERLNKCGLFGRLPRECFFSEEEKNMTVPLKDIVEDIPKF